MNTSIEKLIKKLESNKLKIICIQGPSSSGKSSLLNKISKLSVNPFKINTDDYFYTQKNSNFINYDSPKNIRWIELFTLLDDIKNRKEFLTIYKYSFTTSKSYGPIIINNPFPEEILIEGVYSFYLFADVLVQKKFFNKIIRFECKVIDNKLNIFVRRGKKVYVIANEFSVISIALLICKKLMIKIKVKRDNKERNISKRAIEKQIDYNTWPATINYIYKNLNDFDFIIKHGIFNTSLVENIMNMFRLVKNKPFFLAVSEKKYCCEYCKQENAIY